MLKPKISVTLELLEEVGGEYFQHTAPIEELRALEQFGDDVEADVGMQMDAEVASNKGADFFFATMKSPNLILGQQTLQDIDLHILQQDK